MSLEGSLETIALPDVLALLSVTSKTGELRVESSQVTGSVWMDAGRIAGFDVPGAHSALDALFSLLRLSEGNFYFRAEGSGPAVPQPPQEVAPLLEEAEARLAEWPSIVAVVPSLSSQLELSPSLAGPVTLQPSQWRLVASVGGGKAVGEAIADAGLGEFEGCKALAELVELGLVRVARGEEAPEPFGEEPDLADFAPASELSQAWGEPVLQPAEPEPEPVNRGLLLKFLGSARN